jgi:hypothetical protein
MPGRPPHRLSPLGHAAAHRPSRRLVAATRPASAPLVAGTRAALARSKPELVAANAFLRHQLAILRRGAEQPRCTRADRVLPALLAGRVRAWRHALLIVRPDTLLRWHRQPLCDYWRRPSRAAAPAHRPPLDLETVALSREMATANRPWGAERIRGERRTLDIRVATSTIPRHPRAARPPQRAGQPGATFLRNHAGAIWARDRLPLADLPSRPVYACFVIALGSRRVRHAGVTRRPTAARVARPLREATPVDERPRCLIRDDDGKYGPASARVAAASGLTVLRTAYRAPRQDAVCERFLGSVRRECRDHILILGEAHLRRALRDYAQYSNHHRPHQGLAQRIPTAPEVGSAPAGRAGGVRAVPVLHGLHHTYTRAA